MRGPVGSYAYLFNFSINPVGLEYSCAKSFLFLVEAAA